MRIGIDARAAAEEPGGRGRYVRELVRHLGRLDTDHEFLLYAREPWQCDLDERFHWRPLSGPGLVWHLRAARAAGMECDVFHSTNSYLTVWFTRVPSAMVVYDMIAFEKARRPQRRAGAIERLTLGPAVRRVGSIAAISEQTRRDLAARHPEAEARTTVIPLAADASFSPEGAGDAQILARHGLERPYVLFTGTLEPRKNLPRLIEAFAGLPAELRAGRELVLAGAPGWETGETLAAIDAHRDRVRVLGFVPDDELPAICRGAELFCYPSLYEGFGLPPLEAMRAGTPVITSNVSSLPEVGGDAVRYVDPLHVADIRAALAELLADPAARQELARRGIERARLFDWATTARRTLELLEATARLDR